MLRVRRRWQARGLSAKFGQKHAGQFMRGPVFVDMKVSILNWRLGTLIRPRQKSNLQRKGAATGEKPQRAPCTCRFNTHFAHAGHYGIIRRMVRRGEFLRCRGGNGLAATANKAEVAD